MSLQNLYNSLKNDVQDCPFTEKDKFLKNVAQLDEKGHEMFYAIVKTHQLENKKDSYPQLPYESKFVSSKLRIDFEKLPTQLKHILCKFMNMHILSMEEEKNRLSYT
jgi:hypothetical protein